MNQDNKLRGLLIEFFELSPSTETWALSQQSIAKWDSLAMVRLITELQSTFSVEFDLDEIDRLTNYTDIHTALVRKGVTL